MAANPTRHPSAKPVYPGPEEPLFRQLRREAHTIAQQLEPRRKATIRLKAFLFPALYAALYGLALYGGHHHLTLLYTCYSLMGLMIVVIFLNVIHDAVHGTIFTSKRANHLLVLLFDLVGANSFIWQLRHVRFHHNYPNVQGWDTDLEQSRLARVFPRGKASRLHRYQHLYLPLLYPFYLPNWLLVRDFRDFFNAGSTVRKLVRIPRAEYVKLFFFKAFFLFYTIGGPVLVSGVSWVQALTAFALLLFTASIFSLLVLLAPHANTQSSFPLPDAHNRLPHPWLQHMLLTTNDICEDNGFTRFFMGCFNYHVAHHLFPNIHHAYYPEITHRLHTVAQQHGLPYRRYPLLHSLRAHYRLLKQNGLQENIFEEVM